MTTFESILLLATTMIVIMLLFFGVVWKLLNDIKEWQKSICDKLCSIRSDTVDIFQELNNIEDNILDDLRDIRINHDKPFELPPNWPWTSCYLPNGNCPNPQRDCINCPRRGDGGSWSTSTNKITEE